MNYPTVPKPQIPAAPVEQPSTTEAPLIERSRMGGKKLKVFFTYEDLKILEKVSALRGESRPEDFVQQVTLKAFTELGLVGEERRRFLLQGLIDRVLQKQPKVTARVSNIPKQDYAILVRGCEACGETTGQFMRRSILKEMARMGWLGDERKKFLAI